MVPQYTKSMGILGAVADDFAMVGHWWIPRIFSDCSREHSGQHWRRCYKCSSPEVLKDDLSRFKTLNFKLFSDAQCATLSISRVGYACRHFDWCNDEKLYHRISAVHRPQIGGYDGIMLPVQCQILVFWDTFRSLDDSFPLNIAKHKC